MIAILRLLYDVMLAMSESIYEVWSVMIFSFLMIVLRALS